MGSYFHVVLDALADLAVTEPVMPSGGLGKPGRNHPRCQERRLEILRIHNLATSVRIHSVWSRSKHLTTPFRSASTRCSAHNYHLERCQYLRGARSPSSSLVRRIAPAALSCTSLLQFLLFKYTRQRGS